jgi:hypothetical protein
VSTPPGGGGQGRYGPGPGRGNPTRLIAVGVVVIAVCVVVLFVLSGGGGPAQPRLAAGDCVPAEGDDALPCDDQAAAYRVLETQDDVVEAAAPASCGEVPGVVAVGWEGEDGGSGTAFCLGPV